MSPLFMTKKGSEEGETPKFESIKKGEEDNIKKKNKDPLHP